MKAVFVHDHRFVVDGSGIVYSPGKLPYAVFNRYLRFFDELLVIGRVREKEKLSTCNLDLSSGDGISFEFVPNISTPKGYVANIAAVKKKLVNHIESADALITRTSILGYIAASTAIRYNKPWAAEVVGCAWDAIWNYGNLNGRIIAPITYLWQRRVLRNAPFAIYVTRKFLQERYPCNGITAGVSDVNIPPVDHDIMAKRKIRIKTPGKPFVFGLIGSLQSRWKGIQTAIKAFGSLRNQLPSYKLRILGDGEKKYWMKLADAHGVTGSIEFVGTLPSGKKVLEWLDDVDVYLQPSLQEGLPRSVVEAMSRGCPVVASTAGGIPELIDNRMLHKPGNSGALERLLLLSLNEKWREEQSNKNFNTAVQYTEDVLDQKRDDFWQSFARYVGKNG